MNEKTNTEQADEELDLEPEALKDLTLDPREADQIVGGNTGMAFDCECGTA